MSRYFLHPPNVISVAAALLVRQGRLLIGKRPAHKTFAFHWEFPGGKIEKGETPEIALVREIKEELDVQIDVHRFFTIVRERGHDLDIDLYAYWCTIRSGGIRMKEHLEVRWVLPGELLGYNLTAADVRLARLLSMRSDFPIG